MAVVGSAIIQMSADTAQMRKDMGQVRNILRRTEKDVKRTGDSIRKAFNITAVVATTVGAIRLVQKAWEEMMEGAKAQQSMLAFTSLVMKAGGDVRGEFEKIKRASAGLLDDAAIRQQTSIAVSLGIPIERVAELMEIARAKSRDMGTSVTQAFGDIAKGIGRGSRLILDNLGIILKIEEANEQYAKQIGKTVAALTDYDKKMAILNATVDQGREALTRYNLTQLTTFEKMQKVEAAATNAITRFRILSAEVFTTRQSFHLLNQGLEALTDRASKIREIEGLERQIKSLNKQLEGGKRLNLLSDDTINKTIARIADLQSQVRELKNEVFTHPISDAFTPPPTDINKYQELLGIMRGINEERADVKFHEQTIVKTRRDELQVLNEKLEVEQKAFNILQEYLNEIPRSQEGWSQTYIEMVKVNGEIEKTKQAMHELSGTFDQGLRAGLDQWINDIKSNFEMARHLAQQTAEAMTDAFSNTFFKIMKGRFKDLKEIFQSFIDDILRLMAQMLARMVVMKIIAGISASYAHQGGEIKKMHSGGPIRRMHQGGGLASDEVPIIAQTGEGIVSRKGMSALDRINEGRIPEGMLRSESSGDTYNILIQANDAKSFVDMIARNPGAIAKIVSDDLRKNGPLRGAIKRAF